MDAVLTAGGIPQPGEPLYEYTLGKPKALLDVAGKPMVQWVLDALTGSNKVERIVVVGLTEDSGIVSPKIAAYVPGQGGLVQNVLAGMKKVLETNPAAHHVLYVSSDIPAITPDMVDWVIDTASQSDEDAYYNLITREVMEARFPNSRRSFTKLKDVEVCGGDMNVLRALTVTGNDELWDRIVAARKNVFKQASLIGFDTLILLALRLITLEQGVERATRRLKITGRAVLCPYAEVGMDVDKPHQLEMVRAYLQRKSMAAAGA